MQLAVGSTALVAFGPTPISCPSEIKAVDSSLDCARIFVVDSPDSLNIQGTDMWVRMSRIQPPDKKLLSSLESPVYHDEEEKREELPAFTELINHPLSDVHIPLQNKKAKVSKKEKESSPSQQPEEEPRQQRPDSKFTEADAALSVSTSTTTSSSVSTGARRLSSPTTVWDEVICTDFEIDGSFIRLKPTDECATCFTSKPVYYDDGGVHVWKVRIESDSSSAKKSSSTISGSDICIGVGQNRDETIHDDFSYESYGWGYYGIGGVIHCNPDGVLGRQVRYGTPFSVHDTVSVILDLDKYTLSFGKNDETFGVAFDFNEWAKHHKYAPQKDTPFYLAVMIGRTGAATLVDSRHYGVEK